jgi:hypothetical protein
MDSGEMRLPLWEASDDSKAMIERYVKSLDLPAEPR